jgi:hypothetical protein
MLAAPPRIMATAVAPAVLGGVKGRVRTGRGWGTEENREGEVEAMGASSSLPGIRMVTTGRETFLAEQRPENHCGALC